MYTAGENAVSDSVESRIDLMARIAWYYHMVDMSQQEIADHLGLPRIKVLRILKEAKECGLVEVRVNAGRASLFQLEGELAAALDLRMAMVVPSGGDPMTSVAHAMNFQVQKALAHCGSIGMGAGRTITRFANVFEKPDKIAAKSVFSLTGNTKPNMAMDPRDISTVLAAKLDIDYFNVWAPAWCPTPAEARAMRRHPSIAVVLERAAKVDAAFVGVGSMDSSMYLRYGYLDAGTIREMAESGLIGEVLGYFFDIRGAGKAYKVRNCNISVDLPMACPVTAVCCGTEKALPFIGARRAGFVDGLIADEDMAREVLRLLAGPAGA